MKIRLKRPFTYQDGPRNTVTLDPGVHDLPTKLAQLALRFGKAEMVVEKKAPENKLAKTPENKAGVGRKTKRRRGAGAKSKR